MSRMMIVLAAMAAIHLVCASVLSAIMRPTRSSNAENRASMRASIAAWSALVARPDRSGTEASAASRARSSGTFRSVSTR